MQKGAQGFCQWLLPKGRGARTDSTAGRPGASPARDHGTVSGKGAWQAGGPLRQPQASSTSAETGRGHARMSACRQGSSSDSARVTRVRLSPRMAGKGCRDGNRMRPGWDDSLWVGTGSDHSRAGHGRGGSGAPHCCSVSGAGTRSPRLGWNGALSCRQGGGADPEDSGQDQ